MLEVFVIKIVNGLILLVMWLYLFSKFLIKIIVLIFFDKSKLF